MRLVVSCLVAALAVAIAGAFLTAHHLTAPANRPVGAPPSDITAETVAIPAPDHVVAGWFVDRAKATGAVLLLHGVGGDRTQMGHRIRLFRDAGYAVLAIDLAAHGETHFQRITFGHAESRSAEAAITWLRGRLPKARIAVVGMSLGGAAALLGNGPVKADAVVLEAVYADIRHATADRIEMVAGGVARPLQWPLVLAASVLLGIAPAELRPLAQIARLRSPVLIIAGGRDLHTPIADSRAMFAAAKEPKALWVIEDAAHTDFEQFAPADYRRRVLGFLSDHMRGIP